MKVALIVGSILILCIVGAFFISVSLGVAAVIGGVFFIAVYALALSRSPLRDDDELYEE